MSNRASPTPFRVGPPSPSSPAAGSQKETQHVFVSSDQIPQTPASPLMSVSTQNYASTFAPSQASPHQAPSQPANLSSPPSSAPMSTQPSQQPTISTTNSFPTPASSVSGHFMNSTTGDDTEHMDKLCGAGDKRPETTSAPDVNMTSIHQTEPEHRRTNHDRPSGAIGTKGSSCDAAYEGSRQVKDGDAMDVDEDGKASSSSDAGLSSLQKDFTSAFHLCKSSHTATGPDLGLDLISLYGLGPVAKSVARTDPITGEKINRLRKSYEGKLKGLGLAGRNKPVRHEPGMPGGLRHLAMWPEEEWQNQKVYGKDIKLADMNSALHNLQSAMKMEPGPVPNNDYWEDVLGHEKPSKNVGAADTAKKATVPAIAARSVSQPNGTPAAAEPERTRPSRGRKRHYDDSSFVGYGEGYADDDDDDVAFYSNTEGAGKKKRKKDHVSKVSTPLTDRGRSYGVGMFGVGAR